MGLQENRHQQHAAKITGKCTFGNALPKVRRNKTTPLIFKGVFGA
jgi:DNA topoisomerase IB